MMFIYTQNLKNMWKKCHKFKYLKTKISHKQHSKKESFAMQTNIRKYNIFLKTERITNRFYNKSE